MPSRSPYVKPIVTQLHYSTERGVSIAEGCKTTGSTSGPVTGGCLNEGQTLPCAATNLS